MCVCGCGCVGVGGGGGGGGGGVVVVVVFFFFFQKIRRIRIRLFLTLYHTILTCNDPEEEGFGKHCEKRRNCSIFSLVTSISLCLFGV